ncbi:MAG: TonB-dependent receptor [Melioribacter sp.]|nr:TonB-dependent receptor [Melioribacter sp.]
MKKIIFLFAFYPITYFSQNNIITGKVLDTEGSPIPSANIYIAGTSIGTTSDINGLFEINYPYKAEDKIIISCIGYETKTVLLKDYNGFLIINLSKKIYLIDEIVVTGTKSYKKIKESPVYTEVITGNEIKNCGYKTLKDVLMEQLGLIVVENHGTGIQLQGLDPAYTLIMIDGEPLIGRTAGTLELSRFDVTNLKQIEIVKGPSSSLYGSEALAGVINLITEFPENPFNLSVSTHIGTYNSYFISGNVNTNLKNLKASIFISRRGSSGYDLTPESVSKTAPQYIATTINPSLEFMINEKQSVKLNFRWFTENQKNDVEILENNQTSLLNDIDILNDLNLSLIYNIKLNKLKNQFKLYATNYFLKSTLNYTSNNSIYEESIFNQYYYKGEYFGLLPWGKNNIFSFGSGYVRENVKADRIEGNIEKSNSHFIYFQHEWIASKFFDLVWGGRYDYHENYSSRISPKISFAWKPFNSGKINISIGNGFKAPTLQQLYLNFTNPTVGYSVFGSTNFIYNLQKLINENQIDKLLINPESIKKLKAENSWSLNITCEYEPIKNYLLTLNLFRNNISDLIEAQPIAIKKNGQSVYTYFNLNKIYTQGVETEVSLKPIENLKIKLGYQYLIAIDIDKLTKIKNGEISKVTKSGRLVKVTEKDYGGLFNRSKHTANINFTYENNSLGIIASLRGIVRSKYGFYDKNGNGVLDDNQEYAPGYSIWYFTLNKTFQKYLQLQVRIENLFNKKLSGGIITMPGRIIYVGISFNYQ